MSMTINERCSCSMHFIQGVVIVSCMLPTVLLWCRRRSAHAKSSFSASEEYHCAFVNVCKLLNSKFAFVIISKHALRGVFDFNNSEM